MYYCKNTLLILLSLAAVLIADSGYNTIYLMEFENQQNEFTNSHLTEALPDLIKENYKFREDIKVEYAGDIRPYLEKKAVYGKESIKGLIINGRFLTINNEFFVEFEAYDIHDWKRLVRRQIFCPVHDIICVHDGFLMAIEQSISPFLTDALNIDQIVSIEKRRERSKKLHLLSEQKLLKFYDQFIGQKRPVLFESIKNGLLIGHSDNYIKIRSQGNPDLINTIQNVELLYNDGQYVYGAVA